ncbi:hypothetical protein NDU88_002807 [Pleurodeles waltl]|uniref:Uncharacterized protein n=1 Tax=Pleurodeles waltl TaxID=8319 RepID=A0AAV7VG27_PLEWA|nr:hypothetical protein NDU88_002807 [Pleurodeles waltl]
MDDLGINMGLLHDDHKMLKNRVEDLGPRSALVMLRPTVVETDSYIKALQDVASSVGALRHAVDWPRRYFPDGGTYAAKGHKQIHYTLGLPLWVMSGCSTLWQRHDVAQ